MTVSTQRPLFLLTSLLALVILLGCAGDQSLLSPLDSAFDDQTTARAAEELLRSDPNGPLPEPQLPPEMVQAARSGEAAAASDNDDDRESSGITYEIKCSSPGAPELAESFERNSNLALMQDIPPDSIKALEQRLRISLADGKDILNSFGYYSGTVEGKLVLPDGSRPRNSRNLLLLKRHASVIAEVTFNPGPQYTIGETTVIPVFQTPEGGASDRPVPPEPLVPGDTAADVPPLPTTLADAGLLPEAPAVANDVLEAVTLIQNEFRNRGFPEATVIRSRFYLDHQTRHLEALVHIAAGPFRRMGELIIEGACSVDVSYLLAKQTWTEGEPWNQDKIEEFRDSLRQSGLFVSIELEPGPETDEHGYHPVLASLESGPERTIGGSVKYDTSFGPGINGFWEHRNLTGYGDSLRLELPIWADMQEFSAKYRLPFFLSKKQDFIAQAGVLNQDLDAYSLTAARAAAGIERLVSRHWKVSATGSVEGGTLRDPDQPRRDYLMFGLPLGANFDSTDSLLDATHGGRAALSLAPYTGEYDGSFSALRSRVDLQRFFDLSSDKSFILALRGSVGAMAGAKAQEVPPTVRFYSGGGGSVRGYEYQSLGPRNRKDDPLGGSSLLEVSIEPRWRISETWGAVAFLDGGMVYENIDSNFGKDMRWGAGVGVRIYTPIGPVRLDVATPVNPRSSDDTFQFYISIGQSF